MSFNQERDKMYMMPVVFGPTVTPRQKPGGGRFIYDEPTKITHYKVVYEVDGAALEAILPPGFAYTSPHVVVTFSALRNIAWLAGRGYDIVHVEVPATYHGKEETVTAMFEPVLWENLCDAILTGREQLGYSKIFGDIQTVEEHAGTASGHISTFGFQFLDIQVQLDKEPQDPETLKAILQNPKMVGKLHYKYLPRTGDGFAEADAQYVTMGASAWGPPADLDLSKQPKPESTFCAGQITWRRPSWEEAPTQAHILQYLHDLGVKRFVGAQKQVVYSSNDLYNQRIVR